MLADLLIGGLTGAVLGVTPIPLFPLFALEVCEEQRGSSIVWRLFGLIPLTVYALFPLALIVVAFKHSTPTGIAFAIGLYSLPLYSALTLHKKNSAPKEEVVTTYRSIEDTGRTACQAGRRTAAQSHKDLDQLLKTGSVDQRSYRAPANQASYKGPALALMVLVGLIYFAQILVEKYKRVDEVLLLTLLNDYPAVFFSHVSQALGGVLLPWLITGFACFVRTKDGRRFSWGLLFTLYILCFISVLGMLKPGV